jgi:hypothetical protein
LISFFIVFSSSGGCPRSRRYPRPGGGSRREEGGLRGVEVLGATTTVDVGEIVVRGPCENIYPAEVENVIMAHPDV